MVRNPLLMGLAYRTLVPYGEEPAADKAELWFEGGPTDVLGTADKSRRGDRYLRWWAGRIEEALDTEGFAVGSALSLADLVLYNAFAEVVRDEEVDVAFPPYRRVPFGDKARTDALLATHPRLKASCEAVATNTNFQKWLNVRGTQGF